MYSWRKLILVLSEWLLFNFTWSIFQLCYGENKMVMMSALYHTTTLSWSLIVLVLWNNSPRVDMLLHSDTLSWFWWISSKYQFYSTYLYLVLTWLGLEPMTYCTRCKHANHYITHAVCNSWGKSWTCWKLLINLIIKNMYKLVYHGQKSTIL